MKIAIFTSLLLSAFSIQAQESCAYFAKTTAKDRYPEWQTYENCAAYTDGKLKIKPNHFAKLAFGSSRLQQFWASGQFFYLKKNGDFLPVLTYDNGADTFQQGLVRSKVDGKIAYYNKNLQMIIPPKYDWAWPFQNGRALVCSGCKIAESKDDEHQAIKGGLWGYIDKSGKEIVPVKYKQDELSE